MVFYPVMFLLIFQPIAIYYSFQAYKEFKGCAMDHQGGIGMGDPMGLGRGGGALANTANAGGGAGSTSYNGNSTGLANPGGNSSNNETRGGNSTRGNYTAFGGSGTRLG